MNEITTVDEANVENEYKEPRFFVEGLVLAWILVGGYSLTLEP
jgi:hypothetical protein